MGPLNAGAAREKLAPSAGPGGVEVFVRDWHRTMRSARNSMDRRVAVGSRASAPRGLCDLCDTDYKGRAGGAFAPF